MTRAAALAKTAPRLALGLAGATGLLAAAAVLLLVLSWDAPVPDAWGFRGSAVLTALAYAPVGAVIAVRRPANAIGWLLLFAGLVNGVQASALLYGEFTIVGGHAGWPYGAMGAWLGSWIWAALVCFILPILLLRFPDGRLLSPRWRAFEWLAALCTAALAAYMALRPGPLQLASYIDNPVALDSQEFLGWVLKLSFASFATAGAAIWSIVLRFRRSAGIERQQLKWLAFLAVPYGVAGLASAILPDKAGQVLYVLLLLLVPVAVGIAILRYRLYDIDHLINRTLVYGATSAAIAIAFLAGLVVLQAVLRPFTAGSEFAVAVSTLASFALIQPIRRAVQSAVDQSFYRSRYDAARTLDAFSMRLRDEVNLDAVRADLIDAVQRTVQPAHASVWLRGRP